MTGHDQGDAADEALDLWVRSAAAQRDLSRRRGRAIAVLVAVFLFGYSARAATAAPKPDAEKPLRFSSRAVVEAVLNWSVAVLVVDSTRSIDWIPERATCVRVSRRPQRWRCDIGGTWYDAHDDARYVTYRLRRCRPDRDAWANTLYRVGRQWRAAVSVDWRGGLRCRLVEPPYIPNADA